jgi:hypothetical protein
LVFAWVNLSTTCKSRGCPGAIHQLLPERTSRRAHLAWPEGKPEVSYTRASVRLDGRRRALAGAFAGRRIETGTATALACADVRLLGGADELVAWLAERWTGSVGEP